MAERVQKQRRSKSAQLVEIGTGTAAPPPRLRKRIARELAKAEAADEDNHSEVFDEEEKREEYLFVKGDDEGELEGERLPLKEKKRRRASKAFSGVDPKNMDLLVVDSRGKIVPASDGMIKINLARLILEPVTEEMVAEFRNKKSSSVPSIGQWRCLLRHSGQRGHPEFVTVKENTGNLMVHCKQHHKPVLQGLKRLIAELPKEHAILACKEYIAALPPPKSSLDSYLGRENVTIRQETLCLIWFLDANIAFHQFDNPIFKQLIGILNGRAFSSSTTMIESILPVLYQFVVEKMCEHLKACRSFHNSYDGWSRHGQRFLSQSYHSINCKSFEYKVMLMDFIFCPVPHFAEVIAGCLSERQETWTQGMVPEPIISGGIADSANNMQAAGRLVWTDDGRLDNSRCQNHMIKGLVEQVEKGHAGFALDFRSITALFVAVTNCANAQLELASFQHLHKISKTALYLFNETRWEGWCKLLQCAIKLRTSLVALKGFAAQQKISAPDDFLESVFFDRLVMYDRHLMQLNVVSKLFQSRSFPTGHLVVLCYFELIECYSTKDDAHNMVSKLESDFKDILQSLVKEVLLGPLCETSSQFLKAAFFHPTICWYILQSGVISDGVKDACMDEIDKDICALEGGTSDGQRAARVAKQVFQEYLQACRERYSQGNTPKFSGFPDLLKDGMHDGISALGFWKGVAERTHMTYLVPLVPAAAMYLALPAGESHDECVFSTSGQVFTKNRNKLSHIRLEQIVVIVMFIRNFGWSQDMLNKWVTRALELMRTGTAQKQ